MILLLTNSQFLVVNEMHHRARVGNINHIHDVYYSGSTIITINGNLFFLIYIYIITVKTNKTVKVIHINMRTERYFPHNNIVVDNVLLITRHE